MITRKRCAVCQHEDREDKPSKVYEQEDIEMFDTGKGYEIDVTGL